MLQAIIVKVLNLSYASHWVKADTPTSNTHNIVIAIEVKVHRSRNKNEYFQLSALKVKIVGEIVIFETAS